MNGLGCGENNVPGAHVRSQGFLGGGQVGYNWQAGHWVYGLEADFQGSNIDGSKTINGPFAITGGGTTGPGIYTLNDKIDWFGTARGRLGLASDRFLVYATGGLIFGHVEVNKYSAYPPPPAAPAFAFPASGSSTNVGWTIGGGIEHSLGQNWSAKVEGLYYNLGSIQVSGRDTVNPLVVPFSIGGKDTTFQGGIVRAGLNFSFGGR